MKKIPALIPIMILLPTLCMAETAHAKEKRKSSQQVDEQKKLNRADREAVLAGIKSYMKSINNRLGENSGLRVSMPIDEKDITDTGGENHYHTGLAIPEKITGYATTSDVNLRTEADRKARSVGRLSFNEEVEVLGITESTDTIDGFTDNWVLVRRNDGTEGWVFGRFLNNQPIEKGKTPPSRKETSRALFKMPADGIITSPFGHRVHPISRKQNSFHSGMDIGAPEGTPVKVAAAGTVRVSAFKKNGYGNLIVIDHGDSLSTYYGHLSVRNVAEGDTVRQGEVIGKVGSTGASTGPHLHFEVRRGDKALDPDAFLR